MFFFALLGIRKRKNIGNLFTVGFVKGLFVLNVMLVLEFIISLKSKLWDVFISVVIDQN